MEANRVYNFNPGPATQPLEVLKEAQGEFLNFKGTGESIIEISHRAKEFEAVLDQAKADILSLMGLGDDYDVLFLQGGASTQFAMIPMNFARDGKVGSYVVSGSFAEKAYKEAEILGVGHIAATSKDDDFRHVPTQDEIKIADNAAYLHLCYNNTIYGTEYHYIPETNGVPLVADMSSDMLSRPLDFSKFTFIYALGFMVVAWGLMMWQAEALVAPFAPNDIDLQKVSAWAMRIFGAAFFMIPFGMISGSFFQGTGKAFRSMFLNACRQVILLIPFLLVLPHFFELQGVFMAQPIADAGAAIIGTVMLLHELKKLPKT